AFQRWRLMVTEARVRWFWERWSLFPIRSSLESNGGSYSSAVIHTLQAFRPEIVAFPHPASIRMDHFVNGIAQIPGEGLSWSMPSIPAHRVRGPKLTSLLRLCYPEKIETSGSVTFLVSTVQVGGPRAEVFFDGNG